jgi:RNA polymerase sigma-70 factor (ECF subfamily)
MNSRVLSIRARSDNASEPWTDEALALACCSGDPRVVAELFERFHLPVTRFLSRLVAGADLEDLVQATFLQVARGKARFDGRSAVRTWLFAIAANVMRQHCRTSARRKRLLWTLTTTSNGAPNDRLSEQVDARRNVQYVRAALESLSEKSRLAFVLCEIEGLSAREAGEVLDSTETAIWKRVSDARKALLRAVEDPKQ